MTQDIGAKRMGELNLTKVQRIRMYYFLLNLKMNMNQEELASLFKEIRLNKKQRILLIKLLDDLIAEKAEG